MRLIVLITATFFVAFTSLADSLRLEGQSFKTFAPIVWAATNLLPKTITVYKTERQAFSDEAISNLLAFASFKKTGVQISADKKTLHWEARNEQDALIRSLDITPSVGWINYFNSDAQEQSTNAARGVPQVEQVKILAAQCLQKLGGDTNQLSFHPASGTEEHRTLYDKKPWKGGHIILDDYTMRGIMLTRQIDGVRFNGASGRGGIAVDFGTDGRIAKLQLVWQKLAQWKTFPIATPDEIIAMIKNGRGVLPSEQSADLGPLPGAVKITIKAISPRYWGETGGQRQDFVYPFAIIDAEARLDGTNTLPFTVECPIISPNSK